MTLLLRRDAAVVMLCTAIALQSPECGRSITVVHHFELNGCPPEKAHLPDSVDQAPYRLSFRLPDKSWEGTCPGFKAYRLFENAKGRSVLYVRLNRGHPCSIDVAYGYVGPRNGRPNERLEKDADRWAEVVAQLLTQDT